MQSLYDLVWSFTSIISYSPFSALTTSTPASPSASSPDIRRQESNDSVLSTTTVDLHKRLASALDSVIYDEPEPLAPSSSQLGDQSEGLPSVPTTPDTLPVEALARPTSIFIPASEAPQRCEYIEPSLPKKYEPVNAWHDLPGVAYVLELFLSGKMVEAEEWCSKVDPKSERMYISMALGCIRCLKGLMSFAEEDLLQAVNSTKHSSTVASRHRKKAPSMSARLYGAAFSSADSNIGHYASMIPSELHAELVYAESLCMKSLLNIAFSGDLFAFVKEVVNVKSCIQIYRALGKYIEHVDSTTPDGIDPHLRSGTYLGLGILNIVLSMMPQRLLSVMEMFGIKGDRKTGLDLLMSCGGWGSDSPDPSIYPAEEGVRRPIADLVIIVFHTLSPTFVTEHVDLQLAESMLKWNGDRYRNGPFHQILQGELEMKRSRPAEAISALQPVASMSSSDVTGFRNLSYMASTEIALALLAMCSIPESEATWRMLRSDATWSKAIYSYGLAVTLLSLPGGKQDRLDEVTSLLKEVPGLRQKIGGKSIPMEKCVSYRSTWVLNDPEFKLGDQLPLMEFAYFMNAFEHSPPTDLAEKIIPALNASQRPATADTPDDREIVRKFLLSVCMRYVAFPTQWTLLSPACSSIVASKKAAFTAAAKDTFEWILTADKLKTVCASDWVVYWCHYELGALLMCLEQKTEAKKHFEAVLSGKQLVPPPSGRTGKYPMEAALNMRASSALEACK